MAQFEFESRQALYSDILAQDDRTPFATVFDWEAQGMAHPVLVKGEGPGIILMHELPGFVPEFWRLANWIVAAGFRVYAPALYDAAGTPHEELVEIHGKVGGMARACVSREIRLFAKSGGSPISDWLRTLAREVHEECGGPGVGAVGLCLTGNFAWSVAVEPSVIAAVAGEPALPFNAAGSIHLDPDEAEALSQRENLEVMALRFDGDPSCKAARFAALEDLLGDRLETRVLPDAAKNPQGNPFPHAVLTKDLIAEDGQPTLEAARDVLAFLSYRL
ncbi:dienelactone hydrolase family protein [Oceanicaulis alexandrii HTCC2633]|uniref:dienelactone hydrolase family protein n=1 Tax=Oceanicaulis sp. HTCC2633 TaxID=314254 RepID=UPI0000668C4C|nr:dienelactone hydrolase family protein [Oceanicaulis sp. HTCC2633]EAP90557.1 dienelactone hydrolase family protein [Oceanicaulis alexandrii HTCC2633] [Oceanicaulis sp. HTCC2633]